MVIMLSIMHIDGMLGHKQLYAYYYPLTADPS